jgi:exodeoxyribonuclease III
VRIVSWNVNGLRACEKKGFSEWLARADAEMACVQEVRAHTEQLPDGLRAPEDFEAGFACAERKGYSGVGYFARRAPDDVQTCLGVDEFDCEGRVQEIRYGNLLVVNVYFPNGSGKERDNGRVPFKLSFYDALRERLQPAVERGDRVLVVGDFNTAHREIDLARPKANRKTSGFLPEECEAFERWLDSGWVDTFRHYEAEGGHYTWWSQRFGVREKNIGWRIDYILASPGAMSFVRHAGIHPDVQGSDHCPVSVDLDPSVAS